MKIEEEKAAFQKTVQLWQQHAATAGDENDTSCRDALAELAKDIEDDFYTVVVLGEFKRGKSTFVNALLGEDFLPTDVLPETATINAIMYDVRPHVTVNYMDGKEADGVPTKEFLQQFSARQRDHLAEQVKYIKIGYPVPFLRNRIVLVDTPGVSDINEQRCEVTYRFLPKANAVLFLLDANSPLKKTEHDFIAERLLPLGIDRILFVVNKYDSVDEEEEPDYLADLEERIIGAFPDGQLPSITLLPLSAKMAMEGIQRGDQRLVAASGIREVQDALEAIVYEGSVEQQKLASWRMRLKEILSMRGRAIENDVKILTASREELAETKTKLEQLFSENAASEKNVESYAGSETQRILDMTDKSLAFFQNRLTDSIVDEVQYYHATDFKDYVEHRVSKGMQRQMENWVASYAPYIDTLLKKLEQELANGLSYHFREHIQIQTLTQTSDTRQDFSFSFEASDVSNATTQAGLIAAGGAGILLLLGGPILMPFLSMAAFPFLQRRFLQQRLEQAKAEIIPDIEAQIANQFLQLRDELHRKIETQAHAITEHTEYAYANSLANLRDKIDARLAQDADADADIANHVDELHSWQQSIAMAITRLEMEAEK